MIRDAMQFALVCLALAACGMQRPEAPVDHKRIQFAVHHYCTTCDTPNVAIYIQPERPTLYLIVEHGLLMPCVVPADVYDATPEGARFNPEMWQCLRRWERPLFTCLPTLRARRIQSLPWNSALSASAARRG